MNDHSSLVCFYACIYNVYYIPIKSFLDKTPST